MLKEIWECNKCGSPCRVEIHFSNDKLPEHIRKESRFRNRACPCNEDVAIWEIVTEQADSLDLATASPKWWCCKAEFGEHEKSCVNYIPPDK